MSISSQVSRVSYAGNGSTSTPYPISFRYDDPSWVVVEVIAADGTVSLLSLGTDYTLGGNGTLVSGNVVTSGVAVPGTSTVRISRDTTLTQTLALVPNGVIPTPTLEAELDKLTMAQIDQERRQDDGTARALRAPANETLPELARSAMRAGMFLGFDEDGNPRLYTANEILGASDGAPDGIGLPSAGDEGVIPMKNSSSPGDWGGFATSVLGRALMAALSEEEARGLIGSTSGGISAEARGFFNALGVSFGENTRNILIIGDSYNPGAYGGFDDVTFVRGSFRSGAATGGGDSGVSSASNAALAPGGSYLSIASGGNLTAGHLQYGTQATATQIHYYLLPGTGTAQLQYSDNGGAWTNAGSSINTALITAASVGSVTVPVYSDKIRSRVTATGGTVNGFIGQSNSGSGVRIINFAISGLEISQFATITEDRWKAIFTGWGIDTVLCTFADQKYVAVASGSWVKGDENYGPAGPLQQLYDWSKQANSSVDWLVVAPHSAAPWFLDPVDATIDPLYAADGIDRSVNERTRHSLPDIEEFCRRNQCGYSNPFDLLPDYEAAYAAGLYQRTTPAITGISRSGDTVSVTFAGGHGLAFSPPATRRASIVGITGSTGANPNGQWLMTAISSTVLQYTVAGAAGTYGGSPTIIIEDGIHLSTLGTKLKAAFIFETSNLRRVMDTVGSCQRIGAMLLASVAQYSGSRALGVYLNAALPILAPIIAAEIRAGLNGREDTGVLMRCTAASVMRLSSFTAGGSASDLIEFYGPTLRPITTSTGKVGDKDKRFLSMTGGGINLGYRTTTADATIGEGDCFILCTGNAHTLTLPPTFGGNETAPGGRPIVIHNRTSGDITVATSLDGATPTPALQKINNATTLTIASGGIARLFSTGSLTSGNYSNWLTW